MEINRRKFLTIAGVSAAAGIFGKQLLNTAASANDTPTQIIKRWAMVIDLKKCREHPDCKECIKACNKSHNIPNVPNKQHEIKWIWKEPYENAFIEQENPNLPKEILDKPAILLCNHCNNPPCTRVCPTQATWKRAKDGLVMMDWHRCIGCRYCMAACPYGSRSFNYESPRQYLKEMTASYPTRTKGVVEKCTFCDERLVRGLKPACVESCPYKAMIFGDLNDKNSDVVHILRNNFTIRRKPELSTQPEIYYIV